MDKMKRMTLQKLTLENFKGMTFCLEPRGRNVSVFGDNETGKTTLADAFSWLLTGKDSQGKADFEIKNLTAAGEVEHGLDHSVEAIVRMTWPDPFQDTIVTLKKCYHEIWQKKRGQPQAVFSGHTTDHFIDGVPKSEKEFKARVTEIAGDEATFRLLTTPLAFPALHWQRQREILMSICGALTEAEIMSLDPKLSDLPTILAGNTVEDHKEIVKAARTRINKELDKVPVRIDEVSRTLPSLPERVLFELHKDLADHEGYRADAILRRKGVETGGRFAELSRRLADVAVDILRVEGDHWERFNIVLQGMITEAAEIEATIAANDRQRAAAKSFIDRQAAVVSELMEKRLHLRDRWHKVEAEVFEDTTETVCRSCGQDLPPAAVDHVRKTSLAAFNDSKAERLKEINERGLEIKEQYNRAVELLEKTKQEAVTPDVLAPMNVRLSELKAAIVNVQDQRADYSLNATWRELQQEKKHLEDSIAADKQLTQDDVERIDKEIFQLDHHILAVKADIDKIERRAAGLQRIADLKDLERRLAADFERLEKELYLCEEFMRVKVDAYEARINSLFKTVRFKLFDQQINGALVECCEITVGGVPYGRGLNNAARINAGCEVCNVLFPKYGLYPPFFIDNAESVSRITPMDTQVIRLVVHEPDKALRVVVHGEEE